MVLPPRPHLIFWILPLVVLGLLVWAASIFFAANIPSTKQNIEFPTTTTSVATSSDTYSVGVVGYSKEGRPIERYVFTNGQSAAATLTPKRVVFVGGMHGGYEWNTVLLAYQAIDYFSHNPTVIPDGVQVEIIPVLNPDGLALVGVEGRFTTDQVKPNYDTGLGRFNANDVDLNRNFDCKWQPQSTWRGQSVSAGTAAFSEPEATVLRNVLPAMYDVSAAVFWHSRGNTVYASECENGVLPLTTTLMTTYAAAAGYQTSEAFDAYSITGDAEGWLASLGIPAITVELETRDSAEWERNLAGMTAILDMLSVTP